jgi:hypothetical protein
MEKAFVVMTDGRQFVLAAEPHDTFWDSKFMKLPGMVNEVAEVYVSHDLERMLRSQGKISTYTMVRFKALSDLPTATCARVLSANPSCKRPFYAPPAKPVETPAVSQDGYYCG